MKKVNNQIYIIYKEYSNKIENTCTIKIKNDSCVNVIRHGSTESRLVLEKDKKHYCPYCTREGSFVFGIFTNTVDIDYSENKCKLDLKYSLDINSQLISNNIISGTVYFNFFDIFIFVFFKIFHHNFSNFTRRIF